MKIAATVAAASFVLEAESRRRGDGKRVALVVEAASIRSGNVRSQIHSKTKEENVDAGILDAAAALADEGPVDVGVVLDALDKDDSISFSALEEGESISISLSMASAYDTEFFMVGGAKASKADGGQPAPQPPAPTKAAKADDGEAAKSGKSDLSFSMSKSGKSKSSKTQAPTPCVNPEVPSTKSSKSKSGKSELSFSMSLPSGKGGKSGSEGKSGKSELSFSLPSKSGKSKSSKSTKSSKSIIPCLTDAKTGKSGGSSGKSGKSGGGAPTASPIPDEEDEEEEDEEEACPALRTECPFLHDYQACAGVSSFPGNCDTCRTICYEDLSSSTGFSCQEDPLCSKYTECSVTGASLGTPCGDGFGYGDDTLCSGVAIGHPANCYQPEGCRLRCYNYSDFGYYCGIDYDCQDCAPDGVAAGGCGGCVGGGLSIQEIADGAVAGALMMGKVGGTKANPKPYRKWIRGERPKRN